MINMGATRVQIMNVGWNKITVRVYDSSSVPDAKNRDINRKELVQWLEGMSVPCSEERAENLIKHEV